MQCGNIMRRAALTASKPEKSAEFYQKVFGFTLYSDLQVILSEGSPLTIGATDDPRPGRFSTVKERHLLAGMIGLISIDEPVEDRRSDRRLGVGNIVLVPEVEDIDHASDVIKAEGGAIPQVLHDVENLGDEDGNKLPSRRFFATDPDGYVLEAFKPKKYEV